MTARAVRLVDVAREAGVSPTTASHVLNGTGRVADATRHRVRDAASRLGFRPNALARSVASGQSHTIGVLAENAAGAFCMPVLIGLNRGLSAHGLASILYDAAHDEALRRDHVRHMVDRHVDGVVVIGEGADLPIAPLVEAVDGPVVHVFAPPGASGATVVGPDERAGGALAARRLVELGRTRIAHVTAAEGLVSATAREQGFTEALTDAGLRPAAVLHGAFTRDWGFAAADALLATAPDVDAVFAGNDAIAFGLAAALAARGRRIPDDVAVVGYDNVAGYSDDTEPYLESVDPRLAEVGKLAATHLVERIADPQTPAPPPVTPVLAAGASARGDGNAERRALVEMLLRSFQSPPVGSPSRRP